MNYFLFVVAILAPFLPAYLLFGKRLKKYFSPLLTVIFCWLLGEALYTLGLFLWTLKGLPLDRFTAFWVYLVFCLAAWIAGGRRVSRKTFRQKLAALKSGTAALPVTIKKWLTTRFRENRIRFLLNGAALLLLGGLLFSYFAISLSRGPWSYPAQAVWGFKAKTIYNEKGLKENVFTNPELKYSHQSYPLNWPILLAVGYTAAGSPDTDYSNHGKTLPPLLAGLLLTLFIGIAVREKVPLAAAVLLAVAFGSTYSFYPAGYSYYAETLLCLFALSGLYCLYCFRKKENRFCLFLGFAFLAAAAWVKNEGLLIFFLGWGLFSAVVLLENKRFRAPSFVLALVLPLLGALVFVLPWTFFRARLDIGVWDFDWTRIQTPAKLFNPETVKTIWAHLRDSLFSRLSLSNGTWIGGAVLLVSGWRTLLKNRGIRFLLVFVLLLTIGYACTFLFSTRPLTWHLNALPRILLLPQAVFCLAALLAWRGSASDRRHSAPPQ